MYKNFDEFYLVIFLWSFFHVAENIQILGQSVIAASIQLPIFVCAAKSSWWSGVLNLQGMFALQPERFVRLRRQHGNLVSQPIVGRLQITRHRSSSKLKQIIPPVRPIVAPPLCTANIWTNDIIVKPHNPLYFRQNGNLSEYIPRIEKCFCTSTYCN